MEKENTHSITLKLIYLTKAQVARLVYNGNLKQKSHVRLKRTGSGRPHCSTDLSIRVACTAAFVGERSGGQANFIVAEPHRSSPSSRPEESR